MTTSGRAPVGGHTVTYAAAEGDLPPLHEGSVVVVFPIDGDGLGQRHLGEPLHEVVPERQVHDAAVVVEAKTSPPMISKRARSTRR